jgi:hypothetical protein
MVTASALASETPQICGEPRALITQRNLGNTQVRENEIGKVESKRPPHRNSARAFCNARRS